MFIKQIRKKKKKTKEKGRIEELGEEGGKEGRIKAGRLRCPKIELSF